MNIKTNKILMSVCLIFSTLFAVDSFGSCDVSKDIFNVCWNVIDNIIDQTDEIAVEKACAIASKKVSKLTNGIYRCKLNDGNDNSVYCVLRTSIEFEPGVEKTDCRSAYRQQNETTCTEYPNFLAGPYCTWN